IVVAYGIGGVADGGVITVRPVAVVRLTRDGEIDKTFGDAGYATVAIDGGVSPNQRAQALALTPDGTLIVVGKSLEPGTKVDGLVAAFDPNGAFLGGEKVAASGSTTTYTGAAVESALSVIAVGQADDGIASRVDVLDGLLDPTYGDAGVAVVKKTTNCHDVLV